MLFFDRLTFHRSNIIGREARKEKGVNISYMARSSEVSSTIKEIKSCSCEGTRDTKKKRKEKKKKDTHSTKHSRTHTDEDEFIAPTQLAVYIDKVDVTIINMWEHSNGTC